MGQLEWALMPHPEHKKSKKPDKAINCVEFWQVKQTPFGSCLKLSPNDVYQIKLLTHKHAAKQKAGTIQNFVTNYKRFPDAREIRKLDFVVGYNKSDKTYGLNGFDNALKLYFADSDEKFMSISHSVSLVPSLSPTITFSLKVTEFLGKPYTDCRRSNKLVDFGQNYTQQTCQTHEFLFDVIETCGCYPR